MPTEYEMTLAVQKAWGLDKPQGGSSNGSLPPTEFPAAAAIAKAWGIEPPNAPKQLPAGAPKTITPLEAATRLVATKFLTTPTKVPGTEIVLVRSKADRAQEAVMRKASDIQRKLGVEGETQLALPDNILARQQEIISQYFQILGVDGVPGRRQLQTQIDAATKIKVGHLYSGEADGESTAPTPDEMRVARDLTSMIGFVPAGEIARQLYMYVYGRAADQTLTRTMNRLTVQSPVFVAGMEKLSQEKPLKWFTPDWISTEIMMTPEEQKDMENTLWAITPTQIIIKRLIEDSFKGDTRTIPLASLVAQARDISQTVVNDGTFRYVDIVRRFGSRLLQGVVDRYGDSVGGLVVLQQLQVPNDPVRIAVRDAIGLRNSLLALGSVAASATQGLQMMDQAVLASEAPYKDSIRPNIVAGLLPSPVVLKVDLARTSTGSIDWKKAEDLLTPKNAEFTTSLHDRFAALHQVYNDLADQYGGEDKVPPFRQLHPDAQRALSDIHRGVQVVTGHVHTIQQNLADIHAAEVTTRQSNRQAQRNLALS